MKLVLTAASLVLAGVLAGPVLAQDADVDRGQPHAMVKDSVITTKIKSKLAAEHLPSLAHIRVDTDEQGVVWLSGSAKSEADIDRALEIVRNTDGVREVKSSLTVRHDD